MKPAAALFLYRLRRELRRGVLPIWILEELEDGPSYGYQLLVRLRADHGAELPIGPSLLYPALGRLRAAGLVRVYHGTTSHGPLRKYYELTGSGRAMLPSLRELRASGPRGGASRAPIPAARRRTEA